MAACELGYENAFSCFTTQSIGRGRAKRCWKRSAPRQQISSITTLKMRRDRQAGAYHAAISNATAIGRSTSAYRADVNHQATSVERSSSDASHARSAPGLPHHYIQAEQHERAERYDGNDERANPHS